MSEEFSYDVFDINSYDYELPEELIAQSPAARRDRSRLLTLDRSTGIYRDEHFYDIVKYLRPGDVLVRNNTKVIPARLFGVKEGTGARLEVLLLHPVEHEKDVWEALVGNAKACKEGTVISFGPKAELTGTCVGVFDEGLRHIRFSYDGIFYEVLDRLGRMPLPPYIHNQKAPNDRYQTVYAEIEGSAAAPTAGFHFTPELLEKVQKLGVEIVDITLHIGLGTFRPVKSADLRDHKMHSEYYHMSKEAADALNKARSEGRRLIAVGTTSTRTLESVLTTYGTFRECSGATELFIYPGYRFKAVDALITNFHLPKSTLVMLVSAMAGRERLLNAYRHAVAEGYRFFSFGDAMFIYDGSKD